MCIAFIDLKAIPIAQRQTMRYIFFEISELESRMAFIGVFRNKPMAIETIEKEQAELKGQFTQFDKRVDRMQTESDNTRKELTEAISGLREDNKSLLARMDAGFQELGNLRRWQWSFIIAAVIAGCAVVGLLFK